MRYAVVGHGGPGHQLELVLDLPYHVPGVEHADLRHPLARVELLGQLPHAPAPSDADDPLGSDVVEHIGLLLVGDRLQRLAELLGPGVTGADRDGVADDRAHAGAVEHGVPAFAQLFRRAQAEPVRDEPAEHRDQHHHPDVEAGIAVGEGPPGEQRGQQHGDGQRRTPVHGPALGAAAVPDREGGQPDQGAGQEEEAGQEGDGGEPLVAVVPDRLGRHAVLDDQAGVGAEGGDQGLAVGAEGALHHRPAEGLAEVGGAQAGVALLGAGGLVDVGQAADGAVPVGQGGECGRDGGVRCVAARDLRPNHWVPSHGRCRRMTATQVSGRQEAGAARISPPIIRRQAITRQAVTRQAEGTNRAATPSGIGSCRT